MSPETGVITACTAILAVILGLAVVGSCNRGPHRYGLSLTECTAYCGRSGVERWNRSESRSHTSSDGKSTTTTHEPYCECVGIED